MLATQEYNDLSKLTLETHK